MTNLQIIGMIFLAAIILFVGFVTYVIYQENREDEEFRKNLIIGVSVVVDNGQQVFVGQVIGKGPGYVRIMTPEGKTAAYGLRCIYPVRE